MMIFRNMNKLIAPILLFFVTTNIIGQNTEEKLQELYSSVEKLSQQQFVLQEEIILDSCSL